MTTGGSKSNNRILLLIVCGKCLKQVNRHQINVMLSIYFFALMLCNVTYLTLKFCPTYILSGDDKLFHLTILFCEEL